MALDFCIICKHASPVILLALKDEVGSGINYSPLNGLQPPKNPYSAGAAKS